MCSRREAIGTVLVIVTVLIHLAVAMPLVGGDGHIRYEMVMQLADGKFDSLAKFSMVQPLLTLAYGGILSIFGGDLFAAASYFNMTVFFAGLVVMYARIYHLFGHNTANLFAILAVGFGMYPHYVAHFYGEVLTSVLLMLCLLFYRHKVIFYGCLVIGILNTPAMMPAAGLALLALAWVERSWHPLAAIALIAGLFMAEQQLKYGGPLSSPYGWDGERGLQTVLPYSGLPGFSYPLLFGLLSLVFAFGKSVFLFIPTLFFLWREKLTTLLSVPPRYLAIMALFVVAVTVTYAKWWAWYGGFSWGARFFLFLVLPMALVAARGLERPMKGWKDRVGAIAIVVSAGWVGLNGLVWGNLDLGACLENDYAFEALCWYAPEFSPLFRPFVVGKLGMMLQWPAVLATLVTLFGAIFLLYPTRRPDHSA
jgi:hypothetical protein